MGTHPIFESDFDCLTEGGCMSLGQPLPPNWEEAFDSNSGRSYFIDHVNKITTWMDPRKWFDPNLPKTFSECKNGELPLGWEEVVDPRYGRLFINHLERQVQIEDPRTQYFKGQKDQMIQNFINIVKNNSTAGQKPPPSQNALGQWSPPGRRRKPSEGKPSFRQSVDPMDMLKMEIDRSKHRVDQLRRELNMNGVSDWKKEREHVKNLISRTDERIQRLMSQYDANKPKVQALLDVAEKERALAEAAILHAKPSTDPAKALEQERKCELLKSEFERAKQINNKSIEAEIKRDKQREEIMKQIHQENQSRRRLMMILESMNEPRRPPARSQTFSDAPHYEEPKIRSQPKVISLIDLSSEERNEHNPPTNRLRKQVPRRIEESQNSVNSHGSLAHNMYQMH